MNKLFLLFFLILPAARGAEPEELYRLTVSKGEAITTFRVETRGTKTFLVLSEANGSQAERSLLPDDVAYLKEKAGAVPPAKEAGCGRNSFRLRAAERTAETIACGERLSASGMALLKLANLLAAYR